jgi:hypothetical protein
MMGSGTIVRAGRTGAGKSAGGPGLGAEPNLQRLRSRLARAKNLRLTGTIVATLTGAGLIAALVADEDLLARISVLAL